MAKLTDKIKREFTEIKTYADYVFGKVNKIFAEEVVPFITRPVELVPVEDEVKESQKFSNKKDFSGNLTKSDKADGRMER